MALYILVSKDNPDSLLNIKEVNRSEINCFGRNYSENILVCIWRHKVSTIRFFILH